MSSRRSSGRLDVGDEVWVELTDQHSLLLEEMALMDSSGAILQGIRMYGTILSKSSNHYVIRLPAAEEDIVFSKLKTNKSDRETTPIYHVVVPDKDGQNIIKEVAGLYLPKPVEGYHLTNAQARREMRQVSKASASAELETSTTTPSAPTSTSSTSTSSTTTAATSTTTVATSTTTVATAPTTTTTTSSEITTTASTSTAIASADPAIVTATNTTRPLSTVSTATGCGRTRRGRRSRQARRRRRHHRVPALVDCDSSESESESDSEQDDVSCNDGAGSAATDTEDANDFMTDDEGERESDHEEVVLTWMRPQTWDKDREAHPIIQELGETEWKVPSDRSSCRSQDTGPQQDPRFRKKVRDNDYLNLFLDALPVLNFWKRIVETQSREYGKAKVSISS